MLKNLFQWKLLFQICLLHNGHENKEHISIKKINSLELRSNCGSDCKFKLRFYKWWSCIVGKKMSSTYLFVFLYDPSFEFCMKERIGYPANYISYDQNPYHIKILQTKYNRLTIKQVWWILHMTHRSECIKYHRKYKIDDDR